MESRQSFAASTPIDCVLQFAAADAPDAEGRYACFAARASGLFRSQDYGQSWIPAYASLGASEPLPTSSVVLAPDFKRDRTVFAGLNGAILVSRDGGVEWQRGHLPSPLPAISALATSPNYEEDETVFAGTAEDGVLISQDSGRKWVAWNFGLLDLNILCLGVSPDFGLDETIFAGTESGLFRSTNGGRAWREVPLPMGFDPVLALAVSPRFARDGVLFAGTENNGLFVSADGGRAWQGLAATASVGPVNQVLIDAGGDRRRLMILLGGALIRSRDGGKTWQTCKEQVPGDCSITAALALDDAERSVLIGYEDGSIARFRAGRRQNRTRSTRGRRARA